jgi:hypothetical protein
MLMAALLGGLALSQLLTLLTTPVILSLSRPVAELDFAAQTACATAARIALPRRRRRVANCVNLYACGGLRSPL